jgi:hypothetical protein
MFLIPGPLIALATFPGVIVHELAHQLFCRWFRVPVLEVCYFRVDNPAGFVIHEPPAKSYHSLFISIGPFLINTILGALIAFPAALPVIKFGEGGCLRLFTNLAWCFNCDARHSQYGGCEVALAVGERSRCVPRDARHGSSDCWDHLLSRSRKSFLARSFLRYCRGDRFAYLAGRSLLGPWVKTPKEEAHAKRPENLTPRRQDAKVRTKRRE